MAHDLDKKEPSLIELISRFQKEINSLEKEPFTGWYDSEHVKTAKDASEELAQLEKLCRAYLVKVERSKEKP